MKIRVHIGIFAHDEQDGIALVLGDLARQDLFEREDVSLSVFVLANGCTDATPAAARSAVDAMPPHIAERIRVLELPFAGKSRTWNHFVHTLCDAQADFIFCMDADIRVPACQNLRLMLERLENGPALVVNSRPRKDIELARGSLSWVDRVTVLASGTASDFRQSIAGSLYLVRAAAVEPIHMPIGLPVEDGFLRAMILTSLLTEPEDFRRIHAEPGIWHVYESLRSIRALVRHQTRLVIGSAINTAVFEYLRGHARDMPGRRGLLRSAAQDDAWLAGVLRAALPRWPSGFVPVHFLVKRVRGLAARKDLGSPRMLLVATLGFAFDLLVYVNAQFQMARGKGAGFW